MRVNNLLWSSVITGRWGSSRSMMQFGNCCQAKNPAQSHDTRAPGRNPLSSDWSTIPLGGARPGPRARVLELLLGFWRYLDVRHRRPMGGREPTSATDDLVLRASWHWLAQDSSGDHSGGRRIRQTRWETILAADQLDRRGRTRPLWRCVCDDSDPRVDRSTRSRNGLQHTGDARPRSAVGSPVLLLGTE